MIPPEPYEHGYDDAVALKAYFNTYPRYSEKWLEYIDGFYTGEDALRIALDNLTNEGRKGPK